MDLAGARRHQVGQGAAAQRQQALVAGQAARRLGAARPGRPGRGDPRSVSDWVLSAFEPEEDADALVAHSADAVETIAREGLASAQARFN
jgi:peptidyl-tRNA hydrolase